MKDCNGEELVVGDRLQKINGHPFQIWIYMGKKNGIGRLKGIDGIILALRQRDINRARIKKY